MGVAGEWGNTTAAIVQPDIRTCGGSGARAYSMLRRLVPGCCLMEWRCPQGCQSLAWQICFNPLGSGANRTSACLAADIFLPPASFPPAVIHVIDAGLTARTPLVEAYEAGTPVGELDLAAGSQGYSPAEAQAELDATGPASSAPAASSAPTASSAASSAAGQAPQAPPPPPPPAADGAAATDGGAAAAAPPAPAPREGQPPVGAFGSGAAAGGAGQGQGGATNSNGTADGTRAALAEALGPGGGAPAPGQPALQLPAGSSVAIQATPGAAPAPPVGAASTSAAAPPAA